MKHLILYFLCFCALSKLGTARESFTRSEVEISDLDLNDNSVDVGPLNESPIIGVLAQEISFHLNSKWPGKYKSFIAASYIKFVEGGGARAIPIWIDKPREYYIDIMSKINGVLFPGGATWFNQSNGYADAGRYIYERAKELNDAGDYFPVWGTCLGFELLPYIDASGKEHREDCSSESQGLPLEFRPDFNQSRLFSDAPEEVVEGLRSKPITSNFHRFCVTERALSEVGIRANWRVMSTNKDWNGFEFISTMEHVKYPIYGVQFHPEKNLYEWIAGRNISHSEEAIRANQYFAQFLVKEARKSNHRFPGGLADEQKHLIYNYQPTYTRMVKSAYEQCYLFPEGTDYVTGTSIRVIATFMSFVIPLLVAMASS